MAGELRIGPSELLRKAMIEHDAGFLKEGVRVLSPALMELEVEEHVGVGCHERSAVGENKAPNARRQWTLAASLWAPSTLRPTGTTRRS